jgi:hypothetical protein
MYVIKRLDQGGGFVAPTGSPSSYVRLQDARIYPTRAAADADRCPENEIVLRLDKAVKG